MSEVFQSAEESNDMTCHDATQNNNALIQNPHSILFGDEMDSSDSEGPVANPELPEEMTYQELEDADTIKDTMFSKHWAVSVLLDFIKYVQNKELLEKPELEEEFHDNLCKLWDISIDEGVSIFLLENEFLELCSACVGSSGCQRAVEISIGILANMSCVDIVREAIENDPQIMKMVVYLLQFSHPPVLVETSRLLTTCISRSKSLQKWMDELREPHIYGCVLFILKSSTNSQLLEGIAEVIDGVLWADDDICLKWSTSEFVGAIMEALIQLGPTIGESGKTFLHILQCISTSETGVQALTSHAEKVCQFSISYLKSICDEDFIVIDDKETAVASALAILNAAFCHWNARKDFISNEFILIRCILKLTEVSSKSGKIQNNDVESEENASNNLSSYINELLALLLRDTLSILLQVSLHKMNVEAEEIKIPKSLQYLETTCDSYRLTFFFESSTNHNLWLDVAKAFNCSRLIDCLTEGMKSLNIH